MIWISLLLCVACGDKKPPASAVDAATNSTPPAVVGVIKVGALADLKGTAGQRGTVTGRLVRTDPKGGNTATALVLSDDTLVYLFE